MKSISIPEIRDTKEDANFEIYAQNESVAVKYSQMIENTEDDIVFNTYHDILPNQYR